MLNIKYNNRKYEEKESNIKRENKLYSYKEQLLEMELKKVSNCNYILIQIFVWTYNNLNNVWLWMFILRSWLRKILWKKIWSCRRNNRRWLMNNWQKKQILETSWKRFVSWSWISQVCCTWILMNVFQLLSELEHANRLVESCMNGDAKQTRLNFHWLLPALVGLFKSVLAAPSITKLFLKLEDVAFDGQHQRWSVSQGT